MSSRRVPPLVYGSVCSGIEAATVAWHPLGWRPAFFSEIEPFPRAVLRHHYPDVPCHGDFTTIHAGDHEPIDLLVGGTPCQSFSIAGNRRGLADERGNLALEFVRLAGRLRPRWLVWENVPGVLSTDGGRAFGTFLGALAVCGYGFAWRILDARHFGVPQRRRRLFVVGHSGDGRRPSEVLLEPESLRGHPAAGGESRAQPAAAVAGRAGARRADGAEKFRLIASTGETAHCLNAGGMGRLDYESETLIARMDCSSPRPDRASSDRDLLESACAAFKAGQSATSRGIGYDTRVAPTLGAAESGSNRTPSLVQGLSVRKLTPRECERLQGFPDDYTAIDVNGKPAADGPRYKALGNSMAVSCMAWIGRRIEAVRMLEASSPEGFAQRSTSRAVPRDAALTGGVVGSTKSTPS